MAHYRSVGPTKMVVAVGNYFHFRSSLWSKLSPFFALPSHLGHCWRRSLHPGGSSFEFSSPWPVDFETKPAIDGTRAHSFREPDQQNSNSVLTCTIRKLSPVSLAKFSRTLRHGFGDTSNDALNARRCCVFKMVRGRFGPRRPSIFDGNISSA